MDKLELLVNDFPTLYARCKWIECGEGWEPLLRRLSGKLEAELLSMPEDDRSNHCVAQLKQKFGGLRCYLYSGTNKMYDAIREAEEEAWNTCEACGKRGSVDGSDYWLTTLCSACRYKTTAIYFNREADKASLEKKLGWNEFGDFESKFYLPSGELFAIGYSRIVYGDHGPYVEFYRKQILTKLVGKYNDVDLANLPPEKDCKIYYYWMYAETDPDVKVYLQLKPVSELPNAPKRDDNKKSNYNRKEGYADYKRGRIYVDPYDLRKE